MEVKANGLMQQVDDRGPRDGPPMLQVMGLGMQLTGWPDEFVDLLASRGIGVNLQPLSEHPLVQSCGYAA